MAPNNSPSSLSKRFVLHHQRKKHEQLQKQSRFSPCPVCHRSFPSYFINDHVNICLDSPSTSSTIPSALVRDPPSPSCSQTYQIVGVDHHQFPATGAGASRAQGLDIECAVRDGHGMREPEESYATAQPSIQSSDMQLSEDETQIHKSVTTQQVTLFGREESLNHNSDTGNTDLKRTPYSYGARQGAGSKDQMKRFLQAQVEASSTTCSTLCSGEASGNVPDEIPQRYEIDPDSLLSREFLTDVERGDEGELLSDRGGNVTERPGPGFKLVQVQKQSQAKLSMLCKFPMSAAMTRKPSVTVLQSGMVLLRSWLSLDIQQRLVQECQGAAHFFHRPTTAGGGSYHLYAMSWGCQWDSTTRRYSLQKQRPPLPAWLYQLSRELASEAQEHSPVYPPKSVFSPDVALVNFYPAKSRELGVVGLGGHQDLDDNYDMPVVSVSVGDSMTFFYRRLPPLSRRKSGVQIVVDKVAVKNCEHGDIAHNREKEIVLESGDVLVFGGESRLVYHGTRNVQPGTRPPGLHMVPGRLNFTFRHVILNQPR